MKNRERLCRLCVSAIFITLAARIACVFLLPQPYLSAELLYRATPLRIDALLIGGLLALSLRGPEAARLRRLASPALLLLAASFIVWDLAFHRLSQAHTYFRPYSGAPVLNTVGYTFIDISSAVLILALLKPGTVLFRMFDALWLRRLGKISYGFYVFHDIFHDGYTALALWLFGPVHWIDHAISAIGLLCTIAIASLSYRFFEAPFLRLKERFTPQPARETVISI